MDSRGLGSIILYCILNIDVEDCKTGFKRCVCMSPLLKVGYRVFACAMNTRKVFIVLWRKWVWPSAMGNRKRGACLHVWLLFQVNGKQSVRGF